MSDPRINVLCIVGAMVGASCLLTTWALVSSSPIDTESASHWKSLAAETESWSPSDALATFASPYADEDLFAFSALFLVGTILAFITPLGGAPQIAGVLGVFSLSSESLPVAEYAAGLAVAFAAACLVLSSLALPLGVGYDSGPIGLKARLLTFSRA